MEWVARNTGTSYERFLNEVGPQARKRGWLSRDEFLEVCEWKSPRTKSRCAMNETDFIREVTRAALSTTNEKFRIEVLTLLHGVNWLTASVILHYCADAPYPILDFRALWSLRAAVPKSYSFAFWWAYTEYCRSLVQRNKMSMRDFDRALWQYSKERQRTR